MSAATNIETHAVTFAALCSAARPALNGELGIASGLDRSKSTAVRLAMEILLLTALMLVNAFLSLSEVAVLPAQPHRLALRVADGERGAEAVVAIRATPSRFLGMIQLGITLIGLLAGAVSGVTLGTELGGLLAGIPFVGSVSTEIGIAVTVMVMTYLWVVLAELVPKQIALAYPEPIAVHVALLLRTLDRLAAIPIHLLAISTRFVAHLFGVKGVTEASATPAEIAALTAQGAASGSIHPAQQSLIERVFRLSERPASEIMTPRPDMTFLDIGVPDTTVDTVADTGHTRYPVYRDVGGEVIGMVRTKDLFVQLAEARSVDLQHIMYPPVFVPEVATIMQVLERMRKSGTHEVLVIDEQGVVQGMISAHDVLEAIVGELPSPEKGDYAELVPRHDGTWLADGALPVEELRATLGLTDFPGDELRHCETVGGLVMAALGRVPITGDRTVCAGITLEVMDMDGRRVDKVLVDREGTP